jgi:hypothetical protein
MESILKAKDFYEQKRCSCGGTLTITFLKINSPVMVKIKPKKHYFEIFVSNKLAYKGMETDLINVISNYVD